MPFPEHSPRFKGITLPPSGWALAFLLSLYIFTGLIGLAVLLLALSAFFSGSETALTAASRASPGLRHISAV